MAEKHHDYDALPTDAEAPTWWQELRVVMIVLAFILLLELISRIIAPFLDYDRENIHAFPDEIAQLEEASKTSGNQKILFYGNSLMYHGLDEKIFADTLEKNNVPTVESTKVTPVGTAMLDWVYLYRRYFSDTDVHPDILVVGFVAHHIHDQERIKLRRLSRHFVAKKDLPLLWNTDLKDSHRITQSVLCNISALEGDQPEHQLGILQTIIPSYREGLNRNNDLVSAWKRKKSREAAGRKGKKNTPESKSTYERMLRFISECKKHDVKVYFVPMPQPEVWNFNPEAHKLIEAEGMAVLDARSIDGMTPNDFSDGYHLGESGKVKFSKWLAEQLQSEIQK